jgi:beta-lactamase regulating signal transducer with metallopeptidase domain
MNEWFHGFQSHLCSASWQIGLLVGIIWGLARMTRRAPGRWHYLLWLLVLVKVYLPREHTQPPRPPEGGGTPRCRTCRSRAGN